MFLLVGLAIGVAAGAYALLGRSAIPAAATTPSGPAIQPAAVTAPPPGSDAWSHPGSAAPPKPAQDPYKNVFNTVVSNIPVVGGVAGKVVQGIEAVAGLIGLGGAQKLDPWDRNSGVFIGLNIWDGILAWNGGPTVQMFDNTVAIDTPEKRQALLYLQSERRKAMAANFVRTPDAGDFANVGKVTDLSGTPTALGVQSPPPPRLGGGGSIINPIRTQEK